MWDPLTINFKLTTQHEREVIIQVQLQLRPCFTSLRVLTWGAKGVAVAHNDLGHHSRCGSQEGQPQADVHDYGTCVPACLWHAADAPQPAHDVGVRVSHAQAGQALAELRSRSSQLLGPATELGADGSGPSWPSTPTCRQAMQAIYEVWGTSSLAQHPAALVAMGVATLPCACNVGLVAQD